MNKVLSKLPIPRKKKAEAPAGRITTDTIAEHREQVLAGGRRFKYPVQYAKYKVVINAIIIAIAALVILVLLGWWQLYPAQNTSDLMYRVTRVIPVSVATVDGESVRYSDYLMRYRSSIQYLVDRDQINLSTEDGKLQSDYVKRQELNNAIADAYAAKLAREQDITLSEDELEAFIIQQRESGDEPVSESTYNSIIFEYYGWSPDEYRQAMRSKLLRQKVAYAVDTDANKAIAIVKDQLKESADLQVVTSKTNELASITVTYNAPIWVPKYNQDGGLAVAAAKLQKGQVSDAVKISTGGGYYFVKLVDSNDSQVQYELIQIPLTVFTKKLQDIKGKGGVNERITIPEPTSEQ